MGVGVGVIVGVVVTIVPYGVFACTRDGDVGGANGWVLLVLELLQGGRLICNKD